MLTDSWMVFFCPTALWKKRAVVPHSLISCNMYLLLMTLLPAIAWYIGTTQQGWMIADRVIKLSDANALQLGFMFYCSMVVLTYITSYWMYWMATTYGAQPNFNKTLMVACYCATPIFIAGILGIYPVFWVDIIVGISVMCYSIYLLYIATPIVMQIPRERGFLYTSSLLASAMVLVIALMGVTTAVWTHLVRPVFVG